MEKKFLSILAAAFCLSSANAQFTVQGVPYTLPEGVTQQAQVQKMQRQTAATTDDTFTMADVEFWVGSGSDSAVFVVQWNNDLETNSLAWGYCWDGTANGEAMIRAIANADPRFYIMTQTGTQYGSTVAGLGYDANGDGEFAVIKDGVTYTPDEEGVIYVSGYDYDGYTSVDAEDYWQGGWYVGYWSYWLKDNSSSDWGYSGSGITGRILSNGCWDGWNFAVEMQSQAWLPIVAAPKPGLIAPKIKTQPESITVSVGEQATISILAKGDSLVYRWFKNDILVADADTSFISFAAAQTTDAGQYYCLVSNRLDTVSTDTITLTVGDKTLYYQITSATEAKVVYNDAYLTYSGTITIPATTEIDASNYAVTAVGEGAFAGCAKIHGIIFTEGVKAIDKGAFADCTGLSEISLPTSLITIGDSVFAGCTGLVDLDLNAATQVGNYAFYNCSAINTLNLTAPTAIGISAFENCNAVSELIFGSSLIAINSRAFANCVLLDTVTLGPNITTLGREVFAGCAGLVAFDFGNAPVAVGAAVFSECKQLADVNFGNRLTQIGDSAFWYCEAIDTLNVPASVTMLGTAAFGHCTGLKAIDIDCALETLPNNLFFYDKALDSVALPATLKTIGEKAFFYCSALRTVTLQGNLISEIGAQAFYSCSKLIGFTGEWGTIKTLYKETFKGCSSLYGFKIPATMDSLGVGVFHSCSELDTIVIPAGVKELPEDLFHSCSKLASITIPASVITIGKNTFRSCSELSRITLPENITSVGAYAFASCSKLDSVSWPAAVTKISDYAFQSCSALTYVEVPEDLTTIGKYAFANCTKLKSLPLTDKTTTLNDYAFSKCNTLTEIILPNQITSLGASVFRECTELTSFTFGTGLITTGTYTFYGCTKLTSVTFNAVQKTLGNYTFYGCTKLTEVDLSDFTSIGTYVFRGCTALTTVTLGKDLTEIGNYDFCGCTKLSRINCYAESVPTGALSGTFRNVPTTCEVYVPENSVSTYKTASYWKTLTIMAFLGVAETTPALNVYGAEELIQVADTQKVFCVAFNRALTTNEMSAFSPALRSKSGDYYTTTNTWIADSLLMMTYAGDAFAVGDTLLIMATLDSETFYQYAFKVIAHSETPTEMVENIIDATVYAQGSVIHISGTENTQARIFNTAGQCITVLQLNTQPVTWQMPRAGIYLVRIANKTFKIVSK